MMRTCEDRTFELLALIIASDLPVITAAVALGVLGYLLWGWIGALIGIVLATSPRLVRGALCRRAAVAARQGLAVARHVHRRARRARHCNAMTR
jgi:hypothetical protein